MNRERWIFVAILVLGSMLTLLTLEGLFRKSVAFSDFIYRYSSPRDSDHFKVNYLLDAAKRDQTHKKVAFIGTSITRDGIDTRLFKERFPQASFYNLGGTRKGPEIEVRFWDQFKESGFDVLVYPLTSVDVFKFSTRDLFFTYPDPHLDFRTMPMSPDSLFSYGSNFLSLHFLALRYRDVLQDVFFNLFIKALGQEARSDRWYFWEQKDLDDPTSLQQKFSFQKTMKNKYDQILNENRVALLKMAELSDHPGSPSLIFYELDPTCSKYRTELQEVTLKYMDQFSKDLQSAAQSRQHVDYHKADSFPCEDYAEMFHFNEHGRLELFERMVKILEPLLGEKK